MGCCNVVAILTMADMVCVDCMNNAGSVWYLEFKLCCEFFLLLNVADMGYYTILYCTVLYYTLLYCTVLHHNIVRLMIVAMVIMCIINYLPPP